MYSLPNAKKPIFVNFAYIEKNTLISMTHVGIFKNGPLYPDHIL